MFRVSEHPSSGVLKTVTAASGTGHNIGTATSLQRCLIGSPDQATLEGSMMHETKKIKKKKEVAFINPLPHKREGTEHFLLSHLRLKMWILTPSRTMGATLLLDDRIRIISETSFDHTRQRDVSNICVGLMSL
jgi:hypothetical protein